jgi:hypothetical protein
MIDRVAAEPGPRTSPLGGARVGGPNEETTTPTAESGGASFQPTFRDLLAIVNPLQHLPIIGAIYRRLTGDTAHPVAQVVGGLIFGGPFGMFGAVLNAAVEQVTGKSLTETAFALARGEMPPTPDGVPTRDVELPVMAQDVPAPTSPAPDAPTGDATPTPTPTPARLPGEALSPSTPRLAATPNGPLVASEAASTAASPVVATRSASGARNLAFYQAHAGARLPPAASFSPPVTTASTAPPLVTPSLQTIAPGAGAGAGAGGAAEPSGGFSAAMLHGLERYRQAKRGETAAQILNQLE